MNQSTAIAIPDNTDPGDTGSNMPVGYGSQNYAGYVTNAAGYLTRFLNDTLAFRRGITSRNVGQIYAVPTTRRGGVLPGNAGLLPTFGYLPSKSRFLGVLYAFTPVREASQTNLAQWAANPFGYTGDAPGDLQQQIQNAPPWRRAAARGDSRQSFRSGIYRGARY